MNKNIIAKIMRLGDCSMDADMLLAILGTLPHDTKVELLHVWQDGTVKRLTHTDIGEIATGEVQICADKHLYTSLVDISVDGECVYIKYPVCLAEYIGPLVHDDRADIDIALYTMQCGIVQLSSMISSSDWLCHDIDISMTDTIIDCVRDRLATCNVDENILYDIIHDYIEECYPPADKIPLCISGRVYIPIDMLESISATYLSKKE